MGNVQTCKGLQVQTTRTSAPGLQAAMFIFLTLMTSAVASPQYVTPRIEQYAPPIPIAFSPPRVPVPIYGPPTAPSEGLLNSPVSIQSPVLAPPAQPEGSDLSPVPVLDETIPVSSPEELVHIPDSSVSIPKGSDQIVLPPGTSISLRDNLGQFSHGFSDRNGTIVSEQGRLLNTNDDWEAVIVKNGSYSYVSPEGTRITVNYIADENGFRATGDHIPTSSDL